MPSAHAVGRAFRASKIWWCVDEPAPKVTRKAYLKNLFAARKSIYAALNTFNCDLFCQSSPPSAQRAATKSDIGAPYGEWSFDSASFHVGAEDLLFQGAFEEDGSSVTLNPLPDQYFTAGTYENVAFKYTVLNGDTGMSETLTLTIPHLVVA